MTDLAIVQAADDVLNVGRAALAGQTYAGETLMPEDSWVAAGPGWARDGCSTLVVHVDGLAVSQVPADGTSVAPPLPAGACILVPTVDLSVTLTYCIPGMGDRGEPPTPVQITAASNRLLAGTMTLFRALLAARRVGTLTSLPDDQAQIGRAIPSGPQGQRAGVTIPVTLVLSSSVAEGS